jgi:DNA mismatch endonuclease, patch repair protein
MKRNAVTQQMRRFRAKHTAPEMAVRRIVSQLGFRFQLHERQLPGRPDLVFRSRRSVIFVNGCFWHGHKRCRLFRMPRRNQEYWIPKIEANRSRDRRNKLSLTRQGWRYLVVWECELKRIEFLKTRVERFLNA